MYDCRDPKKQHEKKRADMIIPRVSSVDLLALGVCIVLMKGCLASEPKGRVETRLIRMLLKDYDVDARPVKNHSRAIKVEFQLEYRELKEIDEPKQAMTSSTYLQIIWTDEFLQWNASDFDGITTIRLGPSRVWKPDLYLHNYIVGGNLGNFSTNVIVSSDGAVKWLAPSFLYSSCEIKVSKFPFDEQTCKLKIGSWTYHSKALQLSFHKNKTSPSLAMFRNSTQWELLSASAEQHLLKYPCCAEKFYDLTYTFRFKRKSLFYVMIIVCPCIVLSLLASFSFLFPVESGERVSLVISVLLGLIVFLLIVNDETPVTSEAVPTITLYLTAMAGMKLLTLLATAFILWMHHHSPSDVPFYLKKLSRPVAFVFCVQERARGKTSRKFDLENGVRMTWGQSLAELSSNNSTQDEIQRFSPYQEARDPEDGLKRKWQNLAKTFDRLFFCLFCLGFVSLHGYIFSLL